MMRTMWRPVEEPQILVFKLVTAFITTTPMPAYHQILLDVRRLWHSMSIRRANVTPKVIRRVKRASLNLLVGRPCHISRPLCEISYSCSDTSDASDVTVMGYGE